jgi:hypothetical protein
MVNMLAYFRRKPRLLMPASVTDNALLGVSEKPPGLGMPGKAAHDPQRRGE